MRPETELLAKTRQIAFHLNASVDGREDMPTLAAGSWDQAPASCWHLAGIGYAAGRKYSAATHAFLISRT